MSGPDTTATEGPAVTLASPPMRSRLPNRRAHWLLDFEHDGHRYTAGIGRFPSGDLAEIFIDTAKNGTALSVAGRDAAVAASLCLQFGCPPDVLRKALARNSDGSPGGALSRLLDILASETTGGEP